MNYAGLLRTELIARAERYAAQESIEAHVYLRFCLSDTRWEGCRAAVISLLQQPMLSTQGVEFIGEINENDKGPFLRDAIALLFPICWPEPFGLVMIEAMACGTPVLAYRAGAVAEVVDEGVTGMMVDNIDQARIASARVAALDRRKVRRRFEERFTARRMARDYVRVYQSLAYHAAQPGRSTKYPVNGGARISGDELVSAADKHAD